MKMIMAWVLLLLVVAAFVAAMGLAFRRKRPTATGEWPVYPKKVLTQVEQLLYQRLIRAFPDHIVLSQVAFSQLVGVERGHNARSIWNRFNRLTADFVLCRKDFGIVAVLELDDRSHDRPARHDADGRKAAILAAAGVPLHRFNVNPLPSEAELRDYIAIHTSTTLRGANS
jgi:hypothetical protein